MGESVEPGQKLGNFNIGEHFSSFKGKLPAEATAEELELAWRYYFKPFTIWADRATHEIYQIGVEEGFEGTFLGIGIGSTLSDVLTRVGAYADELDVYVLPKYPGIAFQLRDEDFGEDLEELTTPFGFMTVFDPRKIIF